MNFLNSPGAVILRELGIKGPWSRATQQPVSPPAAPGQVTPAAPTPEAQVQEAPQMPNLPYRRPKGLVSKLFQAMTGGIGG